MKWLDIFWLNKKQSIIVIVLNVLAIFAFLNNYLLEGVILWTGTMVIYGLSQRGV